MSWEQSQSARLVREEAAEEKKEMKASAMI